jgi:hypothetical protein
MSRTLFSLAGFQVILIGRFWVIAEDEIYFFFRIAVLIYREMFRLKLFLSVISSIETRRE